MADYRKMWEDLGMDVDTHDQLCEVLPQAFGDVYLSQENRPESMDYYNFVVAEIHGVRPAELIEHQKKAEKCSELSACMCRMRSCLRQMPLPQVYAAVPSSGCREERRFSPQIHALSSRLP